MNLTEKSVAKLVPGRGRAQHLDDDVRGFGVRVEPNGRKSFLWRAKVNGKVRFRALGEFPQVSVAEARAAAKEHAGVAAKWKLSGYAGEDPFERKRPPAPARVPLFRELVEAYVERRVREHANRPERAEYSVRWMVKRHFGKWLDRPIDEITVGDVLAVKNACGKRRHLANRAVEFARSIFNWSAGRRDGQVNFWPLAENPARDVETYDEKPRERFLQPAELGRFNDTLKEEPHADLKDFLVLAVTTGARRSDIFAMRWGDIQWERAVWRVPFPKSGESYDVSLLPAAVQVLKRRRAEIPQSEPHVFPGVGRSGHLTDLKKPWNAFRKRAGIPDVHVHDIRRTVGSYLAISGASLQQIGAALGHRSLASTEVYARLHDEAIRGAREAGQAKMLEMMRAAKKRARLAPSKRLPAAPCG